jgi:two-component sensor histidine kinase
VREVHHRIKNNLQGVVGLLRQQISAAPETGFRLERVITQVNAMALVHGLQSHDASERIYLCDMIEAIAQAVTGLAGVTVRCSTTRAQRGPIALASDETVPLALIVNELMVNAVKHRAPESPDITVKAEREDQLARVEITNRSGGPAAEFDWALGQGLGTGLQLVRSLMPHAGARLSIEPRAGEMVATLTLWAPAIELGAVVGTARQASASA